MQLVNGMLLQRDVSAAQLRIISGLETRKAFASLFVEPICVVLKLGLCTWRYLACCSIKNLGLPLICYST